MRTGFLARGGFPFGPFAVSFGLGGGLEPGFTRRALVLLSNAPMTEVDVSLETTGAADDGVRVVVSLVDEPLVDVRVSHEPLTDIELEDEA